MSFDSLKMHDKLHLNTSNETIHIAATQVTAIMKASMHYFSIFIDTCIDFCKKKKKHKCSAENLWKYNITYSA